MLNKDTQLPEICDLNVENSCPSTHFCHHGITNSTQNCCIGRLDPCVLSKSEGEGPTRVRRWYFDVQSKQCHVFTFYGLKGNPVCFKKCSSF